jgi:hypothetical protein
MLFAHEIDKGLVEDAPAPAAGTSRGDFGGVADTQHRDMRPTSLVDGE